MTKQDVVKAKFFVRDIVSSLVPSDALFDAVHEAVADYDINKMSDNDWVECATKIRNLRNANAHN